jgi:AmiR/NasT family two-component response regulator
LRQQVPGSRRLSQRISEDDGIAIIVRVSDADSARAAEAQGAKALAVDRAVHGLRESTTLPVLWLALGDPVDADAIAIRPDANGDHELETVMEVRDEEELEAALEEHDPDIFLISPSDDGDPLELALELLPDVPAGKLAIADVDVGDRDEVLQLERAGFDAVLVAPGHVAPLVGHGPLDV